MLAYKYIDITTHVVGGLSEIFRESDLGGGRERTCGHEDHLS
jgi:hypothetical protein